MQHVVYISLTPFAASIILRQLVSGLTSTRVRSFKSGSCSLRVVAIGQGMTVVTTRTGPSASGSTV